MRALCWAAAGWRRWASRENGGAEPVLADGTYAVDVVAAVADGDRFVEAD
eukprot:CAMPEP_0173189104 /NCGR_PEP_ID=MMETSP1141-20130122/11617_1 /TAXON_ID=483371 /ORGANISM="non described non described, Strain CCMP2298" /LENGTH=49 /DNA_ID=CAMNT_0014113091 /DNA_START=96 /DNA_END=245 /DNA_ORIENTATION=+